MAEVQEICEEHGIDLDDESEPSSSQATRADMFDEEEEIRLEDLVGNPWALSCALCRTFLLIFDFLYLLDDDFLLDDWMIRNKIFVSVLIIYWQNLSSDKWISI